MTPQMVQEKLRDLDVKIGPTTLLNYRTWGLLTPPVTKTLGRGKGRSAEYEDIVPGEIYAAYRMMKSDLDFSALQIKRFRACWLALPNPDAPWPPDVLTKAGALLWGLLRSIANHAVTSAAEIDFHVYSPEQLDEVWAVLRQEEPKLPMEEIPDIARGNLLGLVVIRRRDGEPGLVAAMYPDNYKVVAWRKEGEIAAQ
jgi:hypothetical protein